MFRFNIRDVIWVTVVVAMGVGWWLTSRAADRRFEPLVSRIIALREQLIMAREYSWALNRTLKHRESGLISGPKFIISEPRWEVIDDPLDESISVGRTWTRAD
jgi:hypothetical protein